MKTVKENTPTLRFKGFTDDWEQRKLGEFFQKNREKNNNQFDGDKTISISTMKFKEGGNGASQVSLQKYVVLRTGDIAFEGHKNKNFSFGRFVLNDIGDGIMSPRFTSMRPIENLPIYYWKQYIHFEPIMKKILVKSTKLGTMMNELVVSDLNKQYLNVPSKIEQEKIGIVLNIIDNTISLQQRKLDKLKLLKMAMLQKMFAEKDVPIIRFKGFTDDWEQRKLGDIGIINSGIGFSNSNQGGKKGIPFYKVSDMNNIGNEMIMESSNNYVTDLQIEENKWKVLIPENNGIIFAKVGAAIFLDRKRLVNKEFLIDNNMMSLLFIKAFNSYFGIYLVEKINFSKYAQTGALPSLNGTDIKKVVIKIPQIEEQVKLGKLLKQISNTISLQQRKLDKLKSTKQFLLQNMFI